MIDTVTQCIGIAAMLVSVFSFQCKSQKGIVTVQAISTSMWLIHFTLLGAVSGMLLNALAAIRSVIYANREKHKWAQSVVWAYVFIAASVVIYILTVTVFNEEDVTAKNLIFEALPTIGILATTIGFRLNNGFKVRCSQLISSPLWLIYDACSDSVGGTIAEIIALCSVIVGIIRHDLPSLRKKAQ